MKEGFCINSGSAHRPEGVHGPYNMNDEYVWTVGREIWTSCELNHKVTSRIILRARDYDTFFGIIYRIKSFSG